MLFDPCGERIMICPGTVLLPIYKNRDCSGVKPQLSKKRDVVYSFMKYQ